MLESWMRATIPSIFGLGSNIYSLDNTQKLKFCDTCYSRSWSFNTFIIISLKYWQKMKQKLFLGMVLF